MQATDTGNARNRAGASYAMPDGSVYEITVSAADTDGEWTEMISTLPPGNVPPPPHVHPSQTNDFEVLEGTVEFMIDGRWQTFCAGDKATVPPGTLHSFRNRSNAPARLRDIHRPALNFEDYLEHIHRLLQGRSIKSSRDVRIPIYLSMLTLEYAQTVRSTRRCDKALIRTLAAVGRLLRMNTRVVECRP